LIIIFISMCGGGVCRMARGVGGVWVWGGGGGGGGGRGGTAFF